MRVVLLPSAFAPLVGGVEVTTERLSRVFRDSGHEVEVWTARSPGDRLDPVEEMDGLTVRRFIFHAPRASFGVTLRWPFAAAQTFSEMSRALRRFRPDVLHVQCFGINGVYATALSSCFRTPLVVTLQGETFMDDHEIYTQSTFLRTGLRLGLRRASVVTGCSRFAVRDAAERFGLDACKAVVIFNGTDPPRLATRNEEFPFERFVLAVGRVVRRKGFDLLLRAWASACARWPDTGLVIGGIGPELGALGALAEELGIRHRVHFAGLMSRDQVAAAMEQADVVVMPSRVEAFGLVALEAWRAGTPVIVSACGGAPEFVEHDVTGLVVDPNDTRKLAAAINRLLERGDLREELSAEAGRRLADFEWSRVAERYERAYASIAT